MGDISTTVRIFISSPGDVHLERAQALRVIAGLQRQYPSLALKPISWEELLLPATASFQQTIDYVIQHLQIDIAVFILWSRLGSPLGTEITRHDGSLYRSGTEREFDLMLKAFEQSAHQRPVILAYARDDEVSFREKLTDSPASDLEQLISQRKLAEAFIREQFHDVEGRNIRAYQTYREPIGFAQRLRVHLRLALDESSGASTETRWLEDPYRGLAAFDVQHATIFHGRDNETIDLLQRLRDQTEAGCAFVVIVGASGLGKSSLARAGVAASLLQEGGDDDNQSWRTIYFVPAPDASDPVAQLAQLLSQALPQFGEVGVQVAQLTSGFIKDPKLTIELTVDPAFLRASKQLKRKVRVLIVLDQMEELWTNSRIATSAREQFLEVIEALARSGHVAVLATLRSDFYYQAQKVPTFIRMKGQRGHFDLLPPDAADLQRLIVEPAKLAGLTFERQPTTGQTLDAIILRDAILDPTALPLLQYALSELYVQRDRVKQELTFFAYEQLGGVEGALGKRAEQIFQSLPSDVQSALPELLPKLVAFGTAGDQTAVRQRASLADLTTQPHHKILTEHLIAARFLTTDRQGGVAVASLAHEALLRRWDRISQWIDTNQQNLRLRARVEQNQQNWKQHDRDASFLLAAGLPLEEGRQLLTDAPHLISPSTRDFIATAMAHHEAHAARSRRRRVAVVAGLTMLSLLTSLAATVAWSKQREANQQRSIAVEREQQAIAASKQAHLATQQALESQQAAVVNKNKAERAARDSESRRLATIASNLFAEGSPSTAALLAKAAIEVNVAAGDEVTAEATEAIFQAQSSITGQPLIGHEAPVALIATSKSGNWLATMTGNGINQRADRTLRLWDLNNLSAAPVREFFPALDPPANLQFTDDGRWLINSNDQTIELWDTKPSASQAPLVLSDSTLILCRGAKLLLQQQQRLKWVDVSAGTPRQLDQESLDAIQPDFVSFTDDHRWIICKQSLPTSLNLNANGETPPTPRLVLADLDAEYPFRDAIELRPQGGETVYLAFNDSGRWLTTRTLAGETKLWNLTGPKAILHRPLDQPLPVNVEGVSGSTAISISDDGKWLLAQSASNQIGAWSVDGDLKSVGKPIELDHKIEAIRFLTSSIAMVTTRDGNSRLLHFYALNKNRDAFESSGQPANELIVSSPDGQHSLISRVNSDGGNDYAVVNWADPFAWRRERVIDKCESLSLATVSPDSRILAFVATNSNQQVSCLNLKVPSGSQVLLSGHDLPITKVQFSQDSQTIISAGEDSVARCWATDTVVEQTQTLRKTTLAGDYLFGVTNAGKPVTLVWKADDIKDLTSPLHQFDFPFQAVSHAGNYLLHGDSIWQVPTGTDEAKASFKPTKLVGHQGVIMSNQFSADGRLFASGGMDGATILRRLGPDVEQLPRLAGDLEYVWQYSFSPDNRFLAGLGWRTACIWDTNDNFKLVATCQATEQLTCCQFSNNSQGIAFASANGKIQLLSGLGNGTPVESSISDSNGPILQLYFSQDDRAIGAEHTSGGISWWDLTTTPAELLAIAADRRHNRSVLSPNREWLLTWQSGEDRKLPHLAPFEQLASCTHAWQITAAGVSKKIHGGLFDAFSPLGKWGFARIADWNSYEDLSSQVRVKPLQNDLDNGAELIVDSAVRGALVGFSSSEDLVFIQSDSKTIRTWQRQDNALVPLSTVKLNSESDVRITSFAYLDSVHLLCIYDSQSNITSWDTTSGQLHMELKFVGDRKVEQLIASAEADRLLVQWKSGDIPWSIVDFSGDEPRELSSPVNQLADSVSISKNAQWVLHTTSSSDSKTMVLSKVSAEQVTSVFTQPVISDPQFVRAGDAVAAVINSDDKREVVYWSRSGDQWDGPKMLGDAGVALDHFQCVQDRWILCFGRNGNVVIWDTDSIDQAPVVVQTPIPVANAAILSQCNQLVTSYFDGTIGIWDMATQTEVARKPVGRSKSSLFASLTVNPDQTQLLSVPQRKLLYEYVMDVRYALQKGNCSLWNLRRSPPYPVQLVGSMSEVKDAQFDSDRDCLVTMTGDGETRVWDLSSPNPIATQFRLLNGFVRPLAIDSKRHRLLAESAHDGTRLWRLDPAEIAAEITPAIGRELSVIERQRYRTGLESGYAKQAADEFSHDLSKVAKLLLGRQYDEAMMTLRRIHDQLGQEKSYLASVQQPTDMLDEVSEQLDQAHDNVSLMTYTELVEQEAKNESALNQLAWLLATSRFADVRAGNEAVKYATIACELTEYQTPNLIDTLAAAYAETGDFEKAIEFERRAIAIANKDAAGAFQATLEQLLNSQPIRESVQW